MSSLASAQGSMLQEGAGPRAPPTRDDTVVVAGWSVPRPRVTNLVGELRSFQQHFERVFVALAEGLPSVSSAVQALTAPFAALRDPKRGFAGQLHQHLNSIVDQGHAAIEAVLAHNEAGLESVTALGELAGVLRARLASSLALSHSLRLAGLNARFAVSRLGQQGATFDAVTRELIDLADGAVQLAQTMGATARQTGEVATRLGVAQQTATGPMRAAMAEAETGRQRVSAECDAVLDVVDAELAELNAHGQQVAAATCAVMEAIQRQDIIRQGLDHVIVVLGALDDEFEQLARGPRQTQALMGFSCIQRDASRLIADLLTDVGQQLTALLGLLERPISGVSAAAGAIAERGVDLGELAGRLGGAPDAVVRGLTSLAKHEVGFGECERQMEEFEALLRALRPALNQLDKLPLEIDVISVLLSIEIARQDALAGAARVTDELGAAGARFNALGVAAGEEVAAVAERVALLKGAMKQQRGAWDNLRTLPRTLEGGVASIHELAGSFSRDLKGLAVAGQDLQRRTAGLLRDLAGFGQALVVTDRVRAACAQWTAEADTLREQLTSVGVAPAEPSASLRALIDGFTVFSHKQIALKGAETTAEQASQPGELTLF